MNRVKIFGLGVLLIVFGCSGDTLVDGQKENTFSDDASTLISKSTFPEVISLPNGFRPEGLAGGRGTTFYTGSLGDGSVYKGDLRTGEGSLLVGPQEDRISVGMKVDLRSNLLFVAGGTTGKAFVYDAETGASHAEYLFDGGFINDVAITREAAYFTNSFIPEFYRVALGPGGTPPQDPNAFETIPLGGDFEFIPSSFNANGIVATPNGEYLIIVNSAAAKLYLVDPDTGEADEIEGVSVPNGDGIFLHGKTLYVVQNRLNQIAVVELSSDFRTGTIVETLTSPLFRVPTAITRFDHTLYAVNARFDTPPTPETEYDVVRVELK